MRLTCPTCGAEYEIADAMVPAAGRHVQCTACHARWFVRGATARQDSEDEIMQRLEARSHLRAVPTPLPTPEPEPEPESQPEPESPPAPDPVGPEPKLDAAAAPSESVKPLPAKPTETVTEPAAASTLPEPVRPAPQPSPRAVPAKPAERPMVAGDNVALRPAPRLDFGADPTTPASQRTPGRTRRPGFGLGLMLALVLLALALAAYVWQGDLAARLPAAAPALDSYGQAVDDLRIAIDRRIEGLRR